MQNKIDYNRFIKIYIIISCLLEIDSETVVEEINNKTYNSFIISILDERLKKEIDNKSDLEIAVESIKGIGGYGRIDKEYLDKILEIINKYKTDTIKKIKLEKDK